MATVYRDGIGYTDGAMHVTFAGGSMGAVTGTTITATTKFVAPAGTAAAPSISVVQADKGLYEVATNQLGVATDGVGRMKWSAAGAVLASANSLIWLDGTLDLGNSSSGMRGIGANSILFGGASFGAGAATSRTEINKAVTGIANNTATAVFTVTVPNAPHSASVEVCLTGSLGAGGAVGANEATESIKYNIGIARTAGLDTVKVVSTAYGETGVVKVAGADDVAVTADTSTLTGDATATQTFTIRVTIARGGGSSSNHTCMATATLRNANASGVTIS